MIAPDGSASIKRKLRRTEVISFFAGLAPCLVGMEACASPHHWMRELKAMGHEVRLMTPADVKSYVKRGKTDTRMLELFAQR